MADPNAFVNTLLAYDKDNLPIKVVRHVQQNYTEHPENSKHFVPEVAKKTSAVCHGLVQWITGLILYRSILE